MSTAGDVGVSAATGAAQGFAVAGAPGAAIGAVIGAVSGLFKSKSKKNAKKADKVAAQMADIQNAAKRRQELREAFITRQTALASGAAESGGTASSTVQGGLGGILSQYAYNSRYFDTQEANINVYNKYAKKSAKYSDYAQAAGTLGDAALGVAKYRMGGSTAGTIPKGSTTVTRSTGMGTLGNPVA
jgi:hypothetical protein